MSFLVHAKGDRAPSIADTIEVDDAAFNLTDCTVKFQMRLYTSSTLKVDAVAQVTNAAAGQVRYDWAEADVNADGFYVAWWHIELANGKTQRSPEFPVEIRANAPFPGALCTLDMVRARMGKPGEDVEQDSIIQTIILCVSKAMMLHCEREFAPKTDALTRVVSFDPVRIARHKHRKVRLYPYDLRSATLVRLHPETASPITLVEGEDYELWPIEKHDGVYTKMRLSDYLTIDTDRIRRFGRGRLEITGNWGFPAVPLDVEGYALTTVILHMRNEIQTFTTNFEIDTGRLERPESLPSYVRSGLNRWKVPGLA